MNLSIIFRIINRIIKNRDVWSIYEMFDSEGSVFISGCYLNHDKAVNELYKLRGKFPKRKFGLQMTRMK